MYVAVWTTLVCAVTTAAAGKRILSGYGHCGTDFLDDVSYGLEALRLPCVEFVSVKRRLLVKEWYKKREKYTHLNLLREISETHVESDYKNYYRMNEQLFNELLKKITPYLTRKDSYERFFIGRGKSGVNFNMVQNKPAAIYL
jgi:hypothetical protein